MSGAQALSSTGLYSFVDTLVLNITHGNNVYLPLFPFLAGKLM